MQNSHNLNILTNSLSNDSSRGFTNNVLDKNKLGVEQLKKIEILLKKVNEAMIDINSLIKPKESPISSNDDTLDGGAMDIMNDIKAPDNIHDNSEAKELEFECLPVQEDQNQAFILSDDNDNANNIKEVATICLNKVSKISDAAILFLAKCTELLTELTNLCRKNNDINDSDASLVDNQDANLADDEQDNNEDPMKQDANLADDEQAALDINLQAEPEASEVQANEQVEQVESEIDANAQAQIDAILQVELVQIESLDQKDEANALVVQLDAESPEVQANEQVEQIPFEVYANGLMIEIEPDSLEGQADESEAILQGQIDANPEAEQVQPQPLEQLEQLDANEQLLVQGQDVSSIFSNADLS